MSPLRTSPRRPTRRPPTSNEAIEGEPGRSDPAGLALLRLRIDRQLRRLAVPWLGDPARPGHGPADARRRPCGGRSRWPSPPALTVAGRTDAGVHARGQVAHLDVPAGKWAAAADSAPRRLARLLPPAIRVRAIAPAPDGFDARFSALWRRYSYRVCDDPAFADPLRRHDTLWYSRPLDLDRMNEAARACLGEHDFAAFCRRREGATTIRQLLRLDWDASRARRGRRHGMRRRVLPQHGQGAGGRAAQRGRRQQAARLAGRGARGAACAFPRSGSRRRIRFAWRRSATPARPRLAARAVATRRTRQLDH